MNPATEQRNWKEILFTRRMLTCVFLGFTSGLPLWVLISMVPAWLRSNGVDLATIGLFSLVSLPYTWKFLWSPLMDRYAPTFLGRRRGWALTTQLALLLSIGMLGQFDPSQSLSVIVGLVFAVSLFSASQDIGITGQAFNQINLFGRFYSGNGLIIPGKIGRSPLPAFAHNARYPRMHILNIINRIIIGFLLGNFQIKIKRTLIMSCQKNKPRCITADFVDNIS